MCGFGVSKVDGDMYQGFLENVLSPKITKVIGNGNRYDENHLQLLHIILYLWSISLMRYFLVNKLEGKNLLLNVTFGLLVMEHLKSKLVIQRH